MLLFSPQLNMLPNFYNYNKMLASDKYAPDQKQAGHLGWNHITKANTSYGRQMEQYACLYPFQWVMLMNPYQMYQMRNH